MIRNQRNPVLIKNAGTFELIHFLDCNRTCNIITEHQIKICFYQLSCFHVIKSSMLCQNLLAHCHSHD